MTLRYFPLFKNLNKGELVDNTKSVFSFTMPL